MDLTLFSIFYFSFFFSLFNKPKKYECIAIKKGEMKLKKKSFIKKTRKEEKEELKPGFDQVRNYLEILEILDIEAMYSKLL